MEFRLFLVYAILSPFRLFRNEGNPVRWPPFGSWIRTAPGLGALFYGGLEGLRAIRRQAALCQRGYSAPNAVGRVNE